MIDWPAIAAVALTGLCFIAGLAVAYALLVVVPSLFAAMDELITEVDE